MMIYIVLKILPVWEHHFFPFDILSLPESQEQRTIMAPNKTHTSYVYNFFLRESKRICRKSRKLMHRNSTQDNQTTQHYVIQVHFHVEDKNVRARTQHKAPTDEHQKGRTAMLLKIQLSNERWLIYTMIKFLHQAAMGLCITTGKLSWKTFRKC